MKQTPENLEKQVIKQLLSLKGWWHFPLAASALSYKGAPDRIAIKNGRVIALEIKRKGGKLTPAEEEFKRNWQGNGGEYLWGSADDIISKL